MFRSNFLKKYSNQKGFTLIELLTVIGIMSILATSSTFIYGNLQSSSDVHETAIQIAQMARKARSFSVNGYNDSAYGVFFQASPPRAIFYRGDSYVTRDVDYDSPLDISGTIALTSGFFTGDLSFDKWTGSPVSAGTTTISHVNGETKSITVSNLGMVDIVE